MCQSREERTGPSREDGGDGGADCEDDAVVLEHLLRAIGRAHAHASANQARSHCIREGG